MKAANSGKQCTQSTPEGWPGAGELVRLHTRAAVDAVVELDKRRLASHQAMPIPFRLEGRHAEHPPVNCSHRDDKHTHTHTHTHTRTHTVPSKYIATECTMMQCNDIVGAL